MFQYLVLSLKGTNFPWLLHPPGTLPLDPADDFPFSDPLPHRKLYSKLQKIAPMAKDSIETDAACSEL